MKLKRKVVATTLAASLVLSSAAFAPLSLTGGNKAYADSSMTSAGLPSSASAFVSRLNKVYAELTPTEKATIRTARDQVYGIWTDMNNNPTQWVADQHLLDPVWNQIQTKMAAQNMSGSLTEESLLIMILHLAINYDPTYSGLQTGITYQHNTIDTLAKIAGISSGLNDPGLTIGSLVTLGQAVETYAKSQVSNGATISSLKSGKDALKNGLKSVIDANAGSNQWAALLKGLGVTSDQLLAVRANFEKDSRFSSLNAAENAFASAYLRVVLSEMTSTGGDTGNTGGNTGGTPSPSPSPSPTPKGPDLNDANKGLDNAASKIADLLKGTNNVNNQEGLLKAQAAIEEAIRQAAQVDLSATVKVDTAGVATPVIDVAKLTDVFKTVKAIADSADAKLKAVAPNAPAPEVVATLDLGKVDAKTVQIPISADLVTQAKSNSIDALALKVNGLSLTVGVDQLKTDTTLTVQKQDKTVATNVTTLPVASDVYEFDFTSGGQAVVFTKPVEVRLPVTTTASTDTDLLTLAKIINGKLIFFGGRYNKDLGILDSQRLSFSTYTVVENKVSFADTASVQDWAGRQIQVDASKGIVEGRADGQFAPNGQVTRAEFAKMLVKAFGLEDATATETFSDVNASDWYQPYVAAAVKAGIVNGRSADQFAPNEVVTRAEMATMAARALQSKGYQNVADVNAALAGFKDASSINSTLQAGVALAANLGVVIGTDGSTFNPNGNSTRAEAAVVIYRLLSK